MVTSKKQPDTSTRVVWRMSADMPLGEYVEVGPTSVPSDGKADTPRRRATDTGSSPSTPSAADNGQRRRYEDTAEVPTVPSKVLRPAQVESWQSSSFDLLSGCRTRDVTDTIPDNVFDELFGQPDKQYPENEGG